MGHSGSPFSAGFRRTLPGGPLEELALATPPLLPQEQWAPALKILNSKELYTFRNGEIEVPPGPGLGLDLNEDAIDRYKVWRRQEINRYR